MAVSKIFTNKDTLLVEFHEDDSFTVDIVQRSDVSFAYYVKKNSVAKKLNIFKISTKQNLLLLEIDEDGNRVSWGSEINDIDNIDLCYQIIRDWKQDVLLQDIIVNTGDITSAVTSVNEATGDVILTKGSIGLGNVTNDAQVKQSDVGIAGGVVPLNGSTEIDLIYLPTGFGGDLSYVHTQSSPSATWNITHNLGKFPSVTVFDNSDEMCMGNIAYTDDNSLTITFSASFSGKAYLN